MENIVFKFNATIVDTIEKHKKMPIGNVMGDNSIGNIAYIIEKAGVREDGGVGMSNSLAFKQIDAYLEAGNDTDDLNLDITEALIRDGFLSRALNVNEMRELKTARGEMASKQIREAIKELADQE